MEKCKDCDKKFLDPEFHCEDCLKDVAEDYDKKCPVCRKIHDVKILDSDGHWHCTVCGELYYKQDSRGEIEKILSDEHARTVIRDYVKKETNRTHQAVDISPIVLKHILHKTN